MDNLQDIAKLEQHILETEVILILVTRDYISSKNCRRERQSSTLPHQPLTASMLVSLFGDDALAIIGRRELVETLRLGKPLVLLQETDPQKGAPTVESLEQERHWNRRISTPVARLFLALTFVDLQAPRTAPGQELDLLVQRSMTKKGVLEPEEERAIRRLIEMVAEGDALEWHREKQAFETAPLSIEIQALATRTPHVGRHLSPFGPSRLLIQRHIRRSAPFCHRLSV